MSPAKETKPYFGLTGGWLTFWVTVCLSNRLSRAQYTDESRPLLKVACATDMTLFGYDQGVFSKETDRRAMLAN